VEAIDKRNQRLSEGVGRGVGEDVRLFQQSMREELQAHQQLTKDILRLVRQTTEDMQENFKPFDNRMKGCTRNFDNWSKNFRKSRMKGVSFFKYLPSSSTYGSIATCSGCFFDHPVYYQVAGNCNHFTGPIRKCFSNFTAIF